MKTLCLFFFFTFFSFSQVGVNTTSPEATLHVVATTEPSLIVESNEDVSLRLKSNYNLSYDGESYIEFQNNTSSTQGWMMGMNDDTNLFFGYRTLGGMPNGVSQVTAELVLSPSSRDTDWLLLQDYNPSGVADGMVLRPNRPNYSSCGSSSNYFDDGYFSELYRDTEFIISDRRVKYAISNLNNALSYVTKLQGVRYKNDLAKHPFKKNLKPDEIAMENNFQYGFIAQEVKEVIPEMVVYNSELDLNIIKNYEQLFPFIVESIKEIHSKVQQLEKENAQLRSDLKQLLAKSN